MATIVSGFLSEEAASAPKRWTLDDFVWLDESGRLGGEDEHFELLDGEIIKKLGQGQLHIDALQLVAEALRDAFGRGHTVNQQVPLHLGLQDAPEPDVSVLRGTPREREGRAPRSDEVALLIEIADSRLDTARGAKVGIYARHGIAEYWILNVRGRTLEVRRGPRSETGEWTETRLYGEGESVTPLGASGTQVLLDDLLPRK